MALTALTKSTIQQALDSFDSYYNLSTALTLVTTVDSFDICEKRGVVFLKDRSFSNFIIGHRSSKSTFGTNKHPNQQWSIHSIFSEAVSLLVTDMGGLRFDLGQIKIM